MRIVKTGGLFACAMLLGATAAFAQNEPNKPPANAKAVCKDGTYTTRTARACTRHGGVKQWLQRSDSTRADTTRTPRDTTHSRSSYPRPNCDTMLTGGYRCGPGDTLAPDSTRGNMNRMHRDSSSGTTPNPMHRDTSNMLRRDSSSAAPADTTDRLKDRGRNPDSSTTRTDTAAVRGDSANSWRADTTRANISTQADRTDTNARGATAKCKDGSYSHSHNKPSTCTSHGGVDQWIT